MSKAICITYSRQLGNQYAGAGSGVSDSEGAWMAKLAPQVAARLRTKYGATVHLLPPGDISGDGNINYKDEVAFAQRHPQSGDAVEVSFHSNAADDALLIPGPSAQSRAYAALLRVALEQHVPLPSGDTWEIRRRKGVAITDESPQPAILIEVHRHDTGPGAAWIRQGIESGRLGNQFGDALAAMLRLPALAGADPETPGATAILDADGIRGPKTNAAIDRQCATAEGTKELQRWLNGEIAKTWGVAQ